MQRFINEITNAIYHNEVFQNSLEKSDFWVKEYPVAIVHHKSRIKEAHEREIFEKQQLINAEGYTPQEYDLSTLSQLIPSSYVHTVMWMYQTQSDVSELFLTNKFKNDFWKKIHNAEHLATSFDFKAFDSNSSDKKVEFELREVIRKRKEVHALKSLGFIWMAVIPKECNMMHLFMHYFQSSFCCISAHSKQYYIGWNERLDNINMRYFIKSTEE